MTIRLLTAQDGPAYQELRILALTTDPDVFLATVESESAKHETSFATELDLSYHPPSFGYYGTFDHEDQLLAYCQVDRSYLDKQKHIAFLFNLYVHPEHRHKHLASQLLEHIKTQLATHENIELLYLSCANKNKAGLKFYRNHDFFRCGIKPRSLKWQGVYDDEVEMVCRLLSPGIQ